MSNNPQAEELKRQWEEADRLNTEQILSSLLSTPGGRKFLYYQLSLGKIGQNPFTTNALAMSFACGELNVGQRILFDILSVAPDAWALMQKEANDEHRTRTARLANTADE
jgi:hypothetical protein